MSWTLTKPGIDIKTERRGIELMVFFQYLVRNVVCIEVKQMQLVQTHQSIWRKFTILCPLYKDNF
jgi:hypothetical protein